MSPAVSTFLLEAANFLLLVAALRWLLFRPVRAKLEERANKLRDEEQEAAKHLDEAKQLEADARQRHGELEGELRSLREQGAKDAEAEAHKIVADARAAAARENEALERRLGQFEATQVERMAEASATAAAEALRLLLERIQGPDLEDALLRSACAQASSLAHANGGRVVVRSSRPLPEASRNALATALGRSVPEIELAVDETLGAGLRIETPAGVVDASARGLASSVERTLRERLASGTNRERAS